MRNFVLAAAVAVSIMQIGAAQSQTLLVVDKTDVLTDVVGNKVKVVQGTHSESKLTDLTGTSAGFAVDLAAPMEVWLKQKVTPGGICLGQARVFSPIVPPAGTDTIRVLTVFQPLAESMVLDSAHEYGEESAFHDRWYITPFEESNYQIPADVGLLVTPTEIEALFDYYGIPLVHNDCKLGLVIRVEDEEPIAFPGFELEFRVDTYGFDELPGVEAYHIAMHPDDVLGSAGLDVAPGLWRVQEQRASYTVSGLLGRGLNVLLLRAEGTIQPQGSHLASLPGFPPVTMASSTSSSNPDCDVCTPGPEGPSCPVETPTDDPGCANSGCAPPTVCVSTYRTLKGLSACNDGGGSTTQATGSVTISIDGGVTVPVSINGNEVEVSAGIGAEVTLALQFGPGDGQGCGQCVQMFLRFMECTKTCVVHEDRNCKRIFGVFRSCCHDKERTKRCWDFGLRVAACNKSGTAPDGSTCQGDEPCDE